MTELPEYTTVGITLDRALNNRLSRACPWGIKSKVIGCAIKLIVEAAEARGTMALALLLDDKMELKPKKGTYAPRRLSEERREDEHGGATSPRAGYKEGSSGE